MFSLHSGSEDGRSIGFEKSGVLGSPDQSLIVLSVKLLSASNDTECVFPRVVLSPGINCLPGNDCSPVIFHWRVNLLISANIEYLRFKMYSLQHSSNVYGVTELSNYRLSADYLQSSDVPMINWFWTWVIRLRELHSLCTAA